MLTGRKKNPYTAFRFRLEIEGIIVALVSDVTGLQLQTETEQYEEGGVNDYVHQLPGRTKYLPITLKRGISDLNEMWEWHQDVVQGIFRRKNGSIILMDAQGDDKWRWNFFQAYPVKWVGPDLNADSSAIAFETIDLVHHGIKKG